MTRLTLEDSSASAALKMADGNIGAISVFAQLLLDGQRIDPDCAHIALVFLDLDEKEVYGSNIAIFTKMFAARASRTCWPCFGTASLASVHGPSSESVSKHELASLTVAWNRSLPQCRNNSLHLGEIELGCNMEEELKKTLKELVALKEMREEVLRRQQRRAGQTRFPTPVQKEYQDATRAMHHEWKLRNARAWKDAKDLLRVIDSGSTP